MKIASIFIILVIFTALLFLTGCALFVSTPRIARIQIKGPANHINEVFFALDNSEDKDIHINDRYAIELDFQWLWYEQEDLIFLKKEDKEEEDIPLTPWFICKYRF